MKAPDSAKEHYRALRQLSREELWDREVPAFDAMDARGRMVHVSVVRAVGVAFSEGGTGAEKDRARRWLRALLRDPQEKVRRYAMNALPKLGASAEEETELLGLLETSASERERAALGETLGKIGGERTLATAERLGAPARTLQRVRGNVARSTDAGRIRLAGELPGKGTIYLRCRRGLEGIVEEEVRADGGFRPTGVAPGLVTVSAERKRSFADVFRLRCFATAGFGLGTAADEKGVARLIASDATRALLTALTEGPIRYRLNFCGRGHQRGAVRRIGDEVFRLCPALINDSRSAPWQIDLHARGREITAELVPRLRPDPRFAYRRQDVPAASHPPLAACMARLAGPMVDEIVWDPFCGSGLELVESALRGNVRRVIGTDLSAEAVTIAGDNLRSALGDGVAATFAEGDFRDHQRIAGLGRNSVSLVVSNPPMGRRVPIPNLRGLIADLFTAAETVLRPGGRLVFANPVSVRAAGRRLALDFRQRVDLGGFDVHVERWVRR